MDSEGVFLGQPLSSIEVVKFSLLGIDILLLVAIHLILCPTLNLGVSLSKNLNPGLQVDKLNYKQPLKFMSYDEANELQKSPV